MAGGRKRISYAIRELLQVVAGLDAGLQRCGKIIAHARVDFIPPVLRHRVVKETVDGVADRFRQLKAKALHVDARRFRATVPRRVVLVHFGDRAHDGEPLDSSAARGPQVGFPVGRTEDRIGRRANVMPAKRGNDRTSLRFEKVGQRCGEVSFALRLALDPGLQEVGPIRFFRAGESNPGQWPDLLVRFGFQCHCQPAGER